MSDTKTHPEKYDTLFHFDQHRVLHQLNFLNYITIDADSNHLNLKDMQEIAQYVDGLSDFVKRKLDQRLNEHLDRVEEDED